MYVRVVILRTVRLIAYKEPMECLKSIWHFSVFSRMALSPGLKFVVGLLPTFLIPSALVYASLTVSKNQFGVSIPSWIVVILTIVARPVLFLAGMRYKRWADQRAAAAHGAVLPSDMLLSPWKVLVESEASIESGYPRTLVPL